MVGAPVHGPGRLAGRGVTRGDLIVEVLDDLRGVRALLGRNDEIDVASAEAIEAGGSMHEASTTSSRSRSRHGRAVACSSNVLTVSQPSRRGSPMETGGSFVPPDLRKPRQGILEA